MDEPKLKKLPKNKFARPLKCVIWHIYETYKGLENDKTIFSVDKTDSCGRDVNLADVKRLNHYRAITLKKEMDSFYWIEIYPKNFSKLMMNDPELEAMLQLRRKSQMLELYLSLGDSMLGLYKKMGMAKEGYKKVAGYYRGIWEAEQLEKEGGKVNG